MSIQNVGTLLRRNRGKAWPAIVDVGAGERSLGYADVDDACDAVARGLVARGCGRGDRIGILSANRAEYIIVVLGAMRAGCVPVPINVKLPAEEIAELARDADLRLLFTDATYRSHSPPDVPRVDFGDEGGEATRYADFVDPGPFEAFVPTESDPSLLLYTSGSSGKAKGVLLNHLGHAAHVANTDRLRAGSAQPERQERMLAHAPLYHKAGLRWLKTVLATGATAVLMPGFDARLAIEMIGKYRITHMAGTSTAFGLMLRERDLLDSTDLSSIVWVAIGSEPLSPPVLEQLQKYFPLAAPGQGYGTTETGAPFGERDGRPRPVASVGEPLAGVEVRLEGGATPDEGVLWVKSPHVMIGYHNRPQETAERLRDGWYNTGDVFRRDAEGFYYFVRRADDMFMCGGEKVFPRAVEEILERHPAVVTAAVISEENELKTLVPVAFIVCKPDAQATEESIKAFALANGPKYMHPRRVFIIDALPISATGKVDKAALRERIRA